MKILEDYKTYNKHNIWIIPSTAFIPVSPIYCSTWPGTGPRALQKTLREIDS